LPGEGTQTNQSARLLGGYVYQQHMAVLRMLDILDYRNPVSGMRLENPRRIDAKDFFDDIEVLLYDGTKHRFQVKWGFQQSFDDPQASLSLADFRRASSNLYLGSLFETWRGYQQAGHNDFCHVYTSKSADGDLQPFLISHQDTLPFEGTYYRFNTSVFDQLNAGNRSSIDRAAFEQFLAYLLISFEQPQLVLGDELNHHGAAKDKIIERIGDLGLPESAYLTNQRFDANALYDRLCKLASDANLSSRVIDLISLMQRLDLDPNRGRIEQPAQIDESVFIERQSDLTILNEAIDNIESGLICLVGRPGSGKSWFLEQWHSNRDATPIFYCFRGLDDEHLQDRALEDQALKNLLYDFDRFFKGVLGSHQYANTVEELQERLNALSGSLGANDKRVIVIDGLDHAVRTSNQLATRDRTVIQLVEKLNLPRGIIIVIGTQPGSHLDNLAEDASLVEVTGFTESETESYLTNKLQLQLSQSQCHLLHDASDGLPLILRFIGNQISRLDDFDANIDTFISGIPATGGEIDAYYDYLWQGLPGYHRSGTEGAPHKILKCLAIRKPGFVLTEQRLREVIPRAVISQSDYSTALEQVTPLVDSILLERGEFALFANSLQIYIVRKMQSDADYSDFQRHAYDYCTSHFDTVTGHRFRLQYAYDLELRDEILSTIDLSYIDIATISLFPKNDIQRNIRTAITAAYDKRRVVDVAHLGLLNFYTRHRFENIDEKDVLRNLVYRGDSHEVQHRLLYDDKLVYSARESLDLLLEACALNISLDYGKMFCILRDKISELDDEARRGIDPEAFWGLAISCGQGLTYYRNTFVRNLEGKSQEVKDQYYKKFINAIAEFSSAAQLSEFVEESGFDRYAQLMSLAKIAVLHREDHFEEGKNLWKEHLDRYGTDDLNFLYQGSLLGVDQSEIRSNVNRRAAILDPPENYHVSDEYLEAIDGAFATVCLLAYVGESDELRQIRESVSAMPRSYIREFLEVGFHIKANEGRYLAGGSPELDPNIIRRLVDYEQRGEERPRIVDVSTSSGLGTRLGDLIYTTATTAPEWRIGDVAKAVSHMFLNRLGYAIGGYSYKFPSTHTLLSTVNDIANHFDGTEHMPLISDIVGDIEDDVLAREGYEGARTSALLDVSNLWATVGEREKAVACFQQALRDAHSYGQRKDITFLQAIRSLSHENTANRTGILARIKEFMDLALYLGWMTDWSEVRAVMPELCDELANRSLIKAFEILDVFRQKNYRGYFDSCLRSCLNHCKSDYQLFYALSETAIETRNMYDELVRLYSIKAGLIIRAFNDGETEVALDLLGHLKLFLLRDVAQSERGKLVHIYNSTAVSLGEEPIRDIPEEPSGNDRNRPESIRFDGTEIPFSDFASEVESAGAERLLEINQLIDSDVGSYYAGRAILERLIVLAPTVSEQQLNELRQQISDSAINSELSDALWALAVAYQRLGNSGRFNELAKEAITAERGWGGVFSEDNEERLSALAQTDRQWVEDFLIDRLYGSAIDGLYIDTAYAIPTIQAVDLAVGDQDRAHQLWNVFHDVLLSLFRHAPEKESPFTGLHNDSSVTVPQAATSALLRRLESDELAVKYRTAETIADHLISHPDFAQHIVDALVTSTHRTAKILMLALLQYAHTEGLYDLRAHRETLEQQLNDEHDFYLATQLQHILHEIGYEEPSLSLTGPGIIQLFHPSVAFVEKILTNCMPYTRRLLSMVATEFDMDSNQLKARVEIACQRAGIDLDILESQLREQVYEYRSPQGDKTVPFEAKTDYAVLSALNHVVTDLLSGNGSVDRQELYEGMRAHDPLVWKIPTLSRPSHIAAIPANEDVDRWFDEVREVRDELTVDELTLDIVLAETESIDSERIGLERRVGAIFVPRGTSLDSINGENINGFLINPGEQYKTINALKYEFVHPTLITHGIPLFSYQPAFWWLQGSYEYLRINPRIEADLELTWSSAGIFDMEFEGVPAVKYQVWRSGFVPEEYSRSEEHSGCFVRVCPTLLRRILEQYDMNILIVSSERRVRKQEQWREGRDEENKSSYNIRLIKV